LPDLSSSSFTPKLSRQKLITFPTNVITFPPFITCPHTFESNQVPFLIAMSPKQCMTHLSQSKQKMNPAASAGVVLPLNSGRVSTSPTPHLPISVNSMPDDLKNMSLEQFLAFVPLEDCPVQLAEVPLTDEHQLTQKVMIFANPDFWDHLPVIRVSLGTDSAKTTSSTWSDTSTTWRFS
jgi:hypothetical protein